MIEISESNSLAAQLRKTVGGKQISRVVAAHSPHKFAWYQGDPQGYPDLLLGKTIKDAYGFGSTVEFKAGDAYVAVSEGAAWRFYEDLADLPAKHQLLLEFADGTALFLTVRMYGGVLCFKQGEVDNDYYLIAKQKPSPLSGEFDRAYFEKMISPPEMEKLSAKAFLATG